MDPASPSRSAEVEGRSKDEEGKKVRASQRVPFYKLFSFADMLDVLLMIGGVIGAVANGSARPIMTLLLAQVINSFGNITDVNDVARKISKVSLYFVYLALGAGLASYLQLACWTATGERQTARIRNLYFKSLLRQDIAFFDKETKTGEVSARMSGDMVLIQDAMGEKVGILMQQVSAFFTSFAVAFVQGWHLALVILAMIPFLVASGAVMASGVAKIASRGQAAYTEAAVVAEQAINSIRTVASFTGEKQSMKKYNKSLMRAYNSSAKEALVAGLGSGTMMLLVFCTFSLSTWYGSKLIASKGYTGGKVINVIFAVLIGSVSLGQASPCLAAIVAGQVAAFMMFETIIRKPEIDVYDTTGKILDDIRGDIEFRDVYFAYPARPNEQIFNKFSFFIQSGMTMALVGGSGSGKSTVISLIERFYDPQAGVVLIDGINLKEFNLRCIRRKIGLVSQEPVLFASSIRDNIAYGKDAATTEEIIAAAALANASKFIGKMRQGLDTMVGERGILLSGGQKQRIAIARAILKDPRILLLDEATSALDRESEQIVQKALDGAMANRTTVVIAHRLSTIRNANTIAVLHQGEIVEKGSHLELLRDPSGVYSQLIRTQETIQDLCPTSQTDDDISEDSVDITQNLSKNTSFSDGTVLKSFSRNSNRLRSVSSCSMDTQNNERSEKSETKVSSKQSEVSIRRLAYLTRPEIPLYLLGTAVAIGDGVIFPLFGMLLSKIITTFYQPQPKLQKDSDFWSLMFVLLGVMALMATTSRTYLFTMAGSKLIRRIRLMTFEKVVHMEIGWFDDTENSSRTIGSRLSVDVAAVRSLVGDTLSLVVQNTASLIFGLAIAFTANWQLSLIFLALIPLKAANFWIQTMFTKHSTEKAKVMYKEASQVAIGAVGNIRTVASFSAEDKVMQLYKMKCEGPTRTRIKQGMVSASGFGVASFFFFCVDALIFYAAARLLQEGKTTFSEVFQAFYVLSLAAVGISTSSTLAPDYTKAKSAIASVYALLDRTSKIDSNDNSGITIEELSGNIEFRHVSFRYPTRRDVKILQDFCLAIKYGKVVALVGESGCGKSTVISLLQRFYDPDSGHILLDGVDIQKFQVRWLRKQMGLVSQEPTLFDDTIRANIAYGKEGRATEAEITSAAELSNAHTFISSLQKGYDTQVGEQGTQLSGGQKQRVAIARAIVKDPKILLLDEATSALDVESERVVHDALDRVMVNRTTVIIAHGLSTIKGADLIAVVKNGMIIEQGNHETLHNINNGVYASLLEVHSRASS